MEVYGLKRIKLFDPAYVLMGQIMLVMPTFSAFLFYASKVRNKSRSFSFSLCLF
jgi:hypothetical protein